MLEQKYAFTLGEALLAMATLGVVAALTIIVLSQDTQGKETILKVKKAYSVMSNAYENASTKYGEIAEWDDISSAAFGNNIGNSMNLSTNCGTASNLPKYNDCVPDCPKIYKAGGGSLDTCTSSDVAKMITTDGFSYAFQIESKTCDIDVTKGSENAPLILKRVCGTAMTDIYNSRKGKNKNLYGVDLFLFYITKDGIIPVGLDSDKTYEYKEGECARKITTDAFGCTAKLIYDKKVIEEKTK